MDSITAVAQDYLKVIWSATEWGDPPITTKALAARFGTTPANVTDTMKRLATQGLVAYEPYRSVQLTEVGTEFAVAMVRRHRLIETFLVTTLGYGWDEVHDEAERLEHAASDSLIERIDSLLGHPSADPHGDPIPQADGTVPTPAGAARLSAVASGGYRVLRVSDSDPARLARAEGLGIVPGAVLRVVRDRDDAGVAIAAPAGGAAPVEATHGDASPGDAPPVDASPVDASPVDADVAEATWVQAAPRT